MIANRGRKLESASQKIPLRSLFSYKHILWTTSHTADENEIHQYAFQNVENIYLMDKFVSFAQTYNLGERFATMFSEYNISLSSAMMLEGKGQSNKPPSLSIFFCSPQSPETHSAEAWHLAKSLP